MAKSPLHKTMMSINKKYGHGTILPAGEATGLVIDRLPTGIFDLDMKLGGGIPRGRITMFKGEFSTCKSAVCMRAAAAAQRYCRYCGTPFEFISFYGEVTEQDCECGRNEPMRVVWLDAEHSFDPPYAAKWGISIDDLYVIETEYAEQAIDVADAVIRSGECDLMVVDSVAALTPSIEVAESSEKWQMGVMARLMNKALRKWTSGMNSFGLLSETNVTIILVNQMRVSIGGYRPTMTSPGGKGLDFYESVEVRFKKDDLLLDPVTKRPIGLQVDFVVKKNKTAPPAPPGGSFALYFVPKPGQYQVGSTDLDMQVLKAAIFWKLIVKKGSWYQLPGGEKFQGLRPTAECLKENPELLSSLMEEIEARELAWVNTGDAGETEVEVEEEEEDD